MILETDIFEMWMGKIMERFDRHERLLASLTGKEVKEIKYLDGERLLDNQDLCQLLQASKRSLQRYRSSGILRYQMLWHKIYYKAARSRKAGVERQMLPNGRHKLPRGTETAAAAYPPLNFAGHRQDAII